MMLLFDKKQSSCIFLSFFLCSLGIIIINSISVLEETEKLDKLQKTLDITRKRTERYSVVFFSLP
jgi:hypothetical protein